MVILIGEFFFHNFDIFFAQFSLSSKFSLFFFSNTRSLTNLNFFASGEFHEE